MPLTTSARAGPPARRAALAMAVLLTAATGTAHADEGKKACFADAKRLCAHEMGTLSRSKVQACMIIHMEQTSPVCHAYMVKARDAAQAAQASQAAHKPDPAPQ